jgi:hypothetical protein
MRYGLPGATRSKADRSKHIRLERGEAAKGDVLPEANRRQVAANQGVDRRR